MLAGGRVAAALAKPPYAVVLADTCDYAFAAVKSSWVCGFQLCKYRYKSDFIHSGHVKKHFYGYDLLFTKEVP